MSYKSVVKYKINLVSVFNTAFSDKSSEVKDALREYLMDEGLKGAFADEIIFEIIKNTESGKDRFGSEFKKYSTAYVNSQVFKLYGKSKSDVNLTMTGEMISSMVPETTSQGVNIGFADEFNAAKAHGHIHGIKSKEYGKVKRDFFGLDKKTEASILRKLVIEASRGANLARLSDYLPSFNYTPGPSNVEGEAA
jgi:hypothetical protein